MAQRIAVAFTKFTNYRYTAVQALYRIHTYQTSIPGFKHPSSHLVIIIIIHYSKEKQIESLGALCAEKSIKIWPVTLVLPVTLTQMLNKCRIIFDQWPSVFIAANENRPSFSLKLEVSFGGWWICFSVIFLSILEVSIQSFNWPNRRDDESTKGGGEERWSAGRRRRSNDPAEIPEGTISRKSRHKDALKLIMNMIIVVEIQWFSIIELWIVILRFQFNKTHNVVLELRALRGTT